MYLQVRPLGPTAGSVPPAEAVVDQGKSATLGGVTIDFVREKRFTLLQVARNPGIPIFFAAAFLLVGGLAITFYFPHRRVRGIVATTPTGSQATLAPLARRDWGAQRAFERLLSDVEVRLGVGVERDAHPTGVPMSARRVIEAP